MSKTRNDPLLTIASGVIVFFKVLFAIGGGAMAIAIPALLINTAHVRENMLPSAAGNIVPAMVAVVAVLLIAVSIFALAYHFAQLLGRIIGTVREGDPFVPANADRLARMGWVALIVQGIAIPMTLIVSWLTRQFPEGTVHVDSIFSFNGLILALVMFVLARVFRAGTELREDLEGTV